MLPRLHLVSATRRIHAEVITARPVSVSFLFFTKDLEEGIVSRIVPPGDVARRAEFGSDQLFFATSC